MSVVIGQNEERANKRTMEFTYENRFNHSLDPMLEVIVVRP